MTKVLLTIDFDGVLHSLDDAYRVDSTRLPPAELFAVGLFRHCQALETLLVQHESVELAVHSSWRFTHSDARLRELLGPLGHRLRGIAKRSIENREDSILDLLRRWQMPRSRVVVLDDDPAAFVELADQLIACDSTTALPPVLHQLDQALRKAHPFSASPPNQADLARRISS